MLFIRLSWLPGNIFTQMCLLSLSSIFLSIISWERSCKISFLSGNMFVGATTGLPAFRNMSTTTGSTWSPWLWVRNRMSHRSTICCTKASGSRVFPWHHPLARSKAKVTEAVRATIPSLYILYAFIPFFTGLERSVMTLSIREAMKLPRGFPLSYLVS